MRKIKMSKFSQFANQSENRQLVRPYKKLKKPITMQVHGLLKVTIVSQQNKKRDKTAG